MKILTVYEGKRPNWACMELINELKVRGITAIVLPVTRITAAINFEKSFFTSKSTLDDIDGVLLRSIGLVLTDDQFMRRTSLLKHMEENGIPVMNPIDGLRKARDKYMSLCVLSRHQIPVPQTIITEDLVAAYQAVTKLRVAVIKPLIGSRGFGSVKVEDPDVAFRIMKTILSFGQTLYVQEYIPKKNDRDIRAFVVGSDVIASMYRYAPANSWKTNVAQGARAEPCKLSDELAELAIKVTEILNLWYSGVDIVEGEDGPFVLEVNGAPDWKGLKEVTRVNPAPLIVSYLISKAKK